MPTYQYTCTDCGEPVEAVQKFSDEPLSVCAACGGRLRKVFSPVGIVFKGSGFYRTDSRKGAIRAPTRRRTLSPATRPQRPATGLRIRAPKPKDSAPARGQVFVQREGRLTAMAPVASIAVVGGSGFYEFLDGAEEVKIDTPFGPPSDPIAVGEVAGKPVAFLPRHGRDHRFPPHKIPYRANMWALRSLGVRRVLAPTAVGALTPSYGPGTLVIPDALVDRTTSREQTYFDQGACHVPFADPYCPFLRPVAIETARERLDSRRFGDAGRHRGAEVFHPRRIAVVRCPRADAGRHGARPSRGGPARELALCHVPLALVTDTDAGVDEGEGVTQAEVFEVFAANIKRLRDLVARIIAALPADREDDLCAHALDGITLPFDLP